MNIPEIASQFILPGPVVSHEEITTGLINTTHAITCRSGSTKARFILQSINSAVFPEPQKVMENILRVTFHIGTRDRGTEELCLIPMRSGMSWLVQPDGTFWRCFPFHEGTETFEKISSPDLAFRAAAAFGHFQARLSDLDPATLHETIPNFHHTPTYFAKLLAAVKSDPENRLAEAKGDIDFILSQESLTTALTGAGLPVRVTHNDTKISNILFPTNPAQPPIVIDLDTVMPGLALFDFGDMVRSAASSAAEDEEDLEKVFINNELSDALTDGYLSTAGNFLTPEEKALLPIAPKVITFELATRFLTDHLLGDKYFRTNFPGHNLVRARNQLALLKSM